MQKSSLQIERRAPVGGCSTQQARARQHEARALPTAVIPMEPLLSSPPYKFEGEEEEKEGQEEEEFEAAPPTGHSFIRHWSQTNHT